MLAWLLSVYLTIGFLVALVALLDHDLQDAVGDALLWPLHLAVFAWRGVVSSYKRLFRR